MSKLKVNMREIGSVSVFDLVGEATEESLKEVAEKIQRNIRRHRLQRIILNLQLLPNLEPLGLRRLMAACIRPQRSLIFGASPKLTSFLEETYIPKNTRICASEKEVAEDFGPFLLDREKDGNFATDPSLLPQESMGYRIERRRSKRMHVALPISLRILIPEGAPLETKGIATNISEGGLFVEYLDLEAARKVETLEPFTGLRVAIEISPSANFTEEFRLDGKIVRRDMAGKQVGIAVEFVA